MPMAAFLSAGLWSAAAFLYGMTTGAPAFRTFGGLGMVVGFGFAALWAHYSQVDLSGGPVPFEDEEPDLELDFEWPERPAA